MIFTQIIWWFLAIIVVYVYAGYPLLLLLIHSIKGRETILVGTETPAVTLLISAYNEEAIIADKLRNCLELDYPEDKLQVIVISDASADRTDDIVREFASPSISLHPMAERGGKTLGLNSAMAVATGEIVVFSDANAMYEASAIRNLISRLSDPAVGAVVGESKYADVSGRADENESLYWRYEVAIKRLESQTGSVVGGDGAIYAIRKSLYREMSAETLSDFVNPLQIVEQGYRCVYESDAVSVEKAAGSFSKEYRRKVRIVNRAWRGLLSMRHMLNPLKYGFMSAKLVSHKLLRWLVPLFLVGLLISSAILATDNAFYGLVLLLQIAFYLLALLGYALRDRHNASPLISIPYYFILVNLASAQGIVEAYRGRTYTTWSTPRARE